MDPRLREDEQPNPPRLESLCKKPGDVDVDSILLRAMFEHSIALIL
jgi:hypothetical protein